MSYSHCYTLHLSFFGGSLILLFLMPSGIVSFSTKHSVAYFFNWKHLQWRDSGKYFAYFILDLHIGFCDTNIQTFYDVILSFIWF